MESQKKIAAKDTPKPAGLQPPVWLTEAEAAAYIGVSRETLARARRDQKINPYKRDGKSFAYTYDMCIEYVQNVTNKTVYNKD